MKGYLKQTTKDIDVLKNNVSEIITEVNSYLEKKLKLEIEWGGLNEDINLLDLFASSSKTQMTQDITKEFQSIWTKAIRKVLFKYLKGSNFKEGSHFDIILDGEEYEIKTTSAYWTKEWAGNKNSLHKVGKHILIKYNLGSYGVEEIVILIVDLKCCTETRWICGTSPGTAFSSLKIHVSDLNCVDILVGNLILEKQARKWLKPVTEKI
jgi:hypothetical protein